MKAMSLARKAKAWHTANKKDPETEARLRDPESNPDAIFKEGDLLWDQSLAVLKEAEDIYQVCPSSRASLVCPSGCVLTRVEGN